MHHQVSVFTSEHPPPPHPLPPVTFWHNTVIIHFLIICPRVHVQLCAEGARDAWKTAVRGQDHPAEVSGQEVSAFQGAGLSIRVSAVHAGRDQLAPLLRCHTGK